MDLPMSSRRDEVEQDVNAVVAEARITLDTRLLRKDVIVLSFEITNDFREAVTSQHEGQA